MNAIDIVDTNIGINFQQYTTTLENGALVSRGGDITIARSFTPSGMTLVSWSNRKFVVDSNPSRNASGFEWQQNTSLGFALRTV